MCLFLHLFISPLHLTDVPRELNEKDAREASLAIEIFGEHVVSNV